MATNTLMSHHGESRSSRADKMSGVGKLMLKKLKGKGGTRFLKKFYGSKRRMFLKNDNNFDKI